MYIYIYLYSKREKERERKKSDVEVMCVWVRETSSISYVGEKNERNVPPRDKTHEKGGDNRIFFQEGRCGYLGLIFFSKSSLFFFSLLLFVC